MISNKRGKFWLFIFSDMTSRSYTQPLLPHFHTIGVGPNSCYMREKRRVEVDSRAIKTGAVINPAANSTKVDTSNTRNLAGYPDRKQDVKIHD